MAEVIQEGQTPEVVAGANVDTIVSPVIEEPVIDVKAELELAKKELETQFKTEIAGLNRKNSELEKSLKVKELEGKSEEEKTEALRLEKEQIEKDIESLKKGRLVDKHLDSAGLPLEFAKRIVGNDESEIENDIKDFSEMLNKTAQDIADKIINERLGGVPPKAGETPKDSIDVQIKNAQASGDFVTVMTLKEQKRKAI